MPARKKPDATEDRGRLLDVAAVAERIGVTPASVRKYKWRDETFPEPDATFGRSPAWYEATIDTWIASRPGRHNNPGRPKKYDL